MIKTVTGVIMALPREDPYSTGIVIGTILGAILNNFLNYYNNIMLGNGAVFGAAVATVADPGGVRGVQVYPPLGCI